MKWGREKREEREKDRDGMKIRRKERKIEKSKKKKTRRRYILSTKPGSSIIFFLIWKY